MVNSADYWTCFKDADVKKKNCLFINNDYKSRYITSEGIKHCEYIHSELTEIINVWTVKPQTPKESVLTWENKSRHRDNKITTWFPDHTLKKIDNKQCQNGFHGQQIV